MSDSHSLGTSDSAGHVAGHVEATCSLPGCSHLHARIGSLENEVRTLHRTLQNFVHVLPLISQPGSSPPQENHLPPVNLQGRFEQEEEGRGNGENDEERAGGGWEDVPGDQEAKASLQDSPETGAPGEVGDSRDKGGGNDEIEEDEDGRKERGVVPEEESTRAEEGIRRHTSTVQMAGTNADELQPGENNREDNEGVSVRENLRSGVRKALSISVDIEEGENGHSGGGNGLQFGRASVSSGGDSTGEHVDTGVAFSGSSSSPLFASPDSRSHGGIPRRNSISNFRTRGSGGRSHRRQASFGDGVLGRHPPDSNWRGPGGSPGYSYERRPPSPENSWPQMGHSGDFYQPTPGQYPGPYPSAPYPTAPDMMYMPYQVFVPTYPSSPGFPTSPGFSWSPGFPASPSFPPTHGWGASPVPRPGQLDRTTSDGALMLWPGSSDRSGSPRKRSSRRGASASRGSSQKAPESRGRGRGTGSLDPPSQSVAVPVPTPVAENNVPPHARGLLGSAPPSRPETVDHRGPAPNGGGRSSGNGRSDYYMHARTSRSMHDLETVWSENQRANSMSPVGPTYACVNEASAMTGPEERLSAEGDYGGTGYFMPTYPKPKRSGKKKGADTADKPPDK